MKLSKLILVFILVAILYILFFPGSLISWLANRESIYLIKHNGFEINILKNPGNATNAEYLQIEIDGIIKENRKSKGDISDIIVNDSVIKILIKPKVDIGKSYIDTIIYNYVN